jgi:hypothetical protein
MPRTVTSLAGVEHGEAVSAYDPTRRCLTDGCGDPPFFGETASPGYCDTCHVRRVDVAEARERARGVMDRLDAEDDENIRADLIDALIGFEDDYPELRDEVRAYR